MAQLGSRLFFYPLEPVSAAGIKQEGYGNFRQSLNECRQAVSQFLDQLFTQHGIRSVAWNASPGTAAIHEQIAGLAQLLAVLRTLPTYDGAPPIAEAPMRAQAVLYNLARGHAVVHGRTYLADDDLPCITQVTLASMPRERRQALLAFAGANSQTLTVAQVQSAIGARSDDKARHVMADLDWLGIAQHQKVGMGKPSILQLREPWHWITEPTFHSLLTAANLLPKGG